MALTAADKKVVDAFVDGQQDLREGRSSSYSIRANVLRGPAGSELAVSDGRSITWVGVGGTQYQDDTYRYLKKTVPSKLFFGHGSDLTTNGTPRSGSKARIMLYIMHTAWTDLPGSSASFINADERAAVKTLVSQGLAEETSRGKFGKTNLTEVKARLTPKGLATFEEMNRNGKAEFGFVHDARTGDFLRPATRADMLKSLQSGEYEDEGRRVYVRNARGELPPAPPRRYAKRTVAGQLPPKRSFQDIIHEEERDMYPFDYAVRNGNGGGWAVISRRRKDGVVVLNRGLTEKEATTVASKFDRDRRVVAIRESALQHEDIHSDASGSTRNGSVSEEDAINDQILRGMVLGFWLQGWASAMEEAGLSTPRNITEDNVPEPPEGLVEFTMAFGQKVSLANRGEVLWALAEHAGVASKDLEEFGYYLAMEALGHGVSWSDSHADHGLSIPSCEVQFELEDPEDEESAVLAYAEC